MNQQPEHVAIEVDPGVPSDGPARMLVTNDDGIDSPGLRDLARTLAEDHEVVVAAPAHDVSGAGTGIGRVDPHDPIELTRADFDGVEAYAVHGTPGFAVMSAALGAFGARPDLIVSGINAGMNTGTSVVHSGTVGAALTGRTFGVSGVALSLAPGDRWAWEVAMPVARAVVRWVRRRGELTTLNVNVPARSGGPLGTRWATIDEFGHFSVASQGRDGTVIDLDVRDRSAPSDPACDTALCLDGYVTLTLLSPLGVAPSPVDDPDHVAGTA